MEQQDKYMPTETHPIVFPFEELLCKADLVKLEDASTFAEFQRRETIIKQDAKVTNIAFVQSGLVKVSREMRKGKNLILRIANPGSILGISAALVSESYQYSVTALEPVTVRFIDSEVFRDLIANCGSLGLLVSKQISSDNIFNINRLSSLLSKQLPGRVADLILYFSEQIYYNNEFAIPLTRQELAELAGTTKESLIRTLSEFKNDKIIDMNRNIFSINSLNILKTLSRLG